MKSVVFFLFVTFISCACFMTALGSSHPFLLYAIGFGVWVLFAWYLNRRTKRRTERREMEQQFQNHMRNSRR
jgi:hypothetical protein